MAGNSESAEGESSDDGAGEISGPTGPEPEELRRAGMENGGTGAGGETVGRTAERIPEGPENVGEILAHFH